ncbi:MAG: DUF1592 domain-containing protein [Myxococcota bacterium]
MMWRLLGSLLVLSACSSDEAPPAAADITVSVSSPLRRLTRAEYDRTVRDLLGGERHLTTRFVVDDKLGQFDTNQSAVPMLQVEHYQTAAQEISGAMDPVGLAGCPDVDPTANRSCALDWIGRFGTRAFRRPLESWETESLLSVYDAGAVSGRHSGGIRLTLEAILQSPQFLYLTELGDPSNPSRLSDYELASRLSYFLWGSMPDEQLFAAAEAGVLRSDEGIAGQAERMLRDPRAVESLGQFHVQWLGLDLLPSVDKSETAFPAFTPDLAAAMLEETSRFSAHVLLESDGTYEALLTAPFTVAPPELRPLYGIADDGSSLQRLLPGRHAGILTHASFLAVHSHRDQTSPVKRGVLIREEVLCQELMPAPPGVDNSPPEVAEGTTTRERFAIHTADPSCAGCHAFIDPVGWSFEHFDAVGQWRDTDEGNPVDATGELVATDIDGPTTGHLDLLGRLANSSEAHACMTHQWYRYALRRLESDGDAEQLAALAANFEASGGNLQELVLSIVRSPAFRSRAEER